MEYEEECQTSYEPVCAASYKELCLSLHEQQCRPVTQHQCVEVAEVECTQTEEKVRSVFIRDGDRTSEDGARTAILKTIHIDPCQESTH